MTLIVEDGSVVPGANSYATAQEAIDYFATAGVPVVITDGDMIRAANFLDKIYGISYKGFLFNSETQSLLFPRTSFVDNNGRFVKEQTIPLSLKEAQYQAAKLNSEGVELITNPTAESMLSSYTKTVEGAVSKSEEFFAPVNRTQTAFISKYIYPIIRSVGNRTVRA